MQIENHKEEVPFAHYEQQFRAAQPEEMAERTGSPWDGKEFSITLLGTRYAISHPDCRFRMPEQAGKEATIPLPTKTFLLRWLLTGTNAPWQGSWQTFREMPWGELYIKPYTGRVLTRAAFTFGTRLEAFRAAAEKLGATPVSHGDAGYRFELLPGFFMEIFAWSPDEEFPPNAQVLYSDNFRALAAEDRVVAGDILISTLKAHM